MTTTSPIQIVMMIKLWVSMCTFLLMILTIYCRVKVKIFTLQYSDLTVLCSMLLHVYHILCIFYTCILVYGIFLIAEVQAFTMPLNTVHAVSVFFVPSVQFSPQCIAWSCRRCVR